MNEPEVILKFSVKNGKRIYDHPKLREKQTEGLEGKRGNEVTTEELSEKSPNLLAYYYGGIINATCYKNSNLFPGMSEREISSFFENEFLSYVATKVIAGKTCRFIVRDRISGLSSKRKSEFIERVIQWLAENEVVVLSPYEYKYGKYLLPEIEKEVTDNDW